MTNPQFFKVEPNWSTIRPVVEERIGRTYSNAYLSDIWRNHRSNSKVRAVLVDLLGEPENISRLAGGV